MSERSINFEYILFTSTNKSNHEFGRINLSYFYCTMFRRKVSIVEI
jgi:hypothetical protein